MNSYDVALNKYKKQTIDEKFLEDSNNICEVIDDILINLFLSELKDLFNKIDSLLSLEVELEENKRAILVYEELQNYLIDIIEQVELADSFVEDSNVRIDEIREITGFEKKNTS